MAGAADSTGPGGPEEQPREEQPHGDQAEPVDNVIDQIREDEALPGDGLEAQKQELEHGIAEDELRLAADADRRKDLSEADEHGDLEQALLEGSIGEELQAAENELAVEIEQTTADLAAKQKALAKLEQTERQLLLEQQIDPVTPDLQPIVDGESPRAAAPAGGREPDAGSVTPQEEEDATIAADDMALEDEQLDQQLYRYADEPQAPADEAAAGVESVIPDLQPVVELGPGEPSTRQPAEPPPVTRPRIPGGSKTVVAGGAAVVAVAVAVLAVTLGGSNKPQAATPPAATEGTTTAAAAPATTAAEAATTAASAVPSAPASAMPAVSAISAVLTNRPPPAAAPKQKNCGAANNPCLDLPLKPLTVRYTTYTVRASDPRGRALTYRWANTNSCGVFRATGASAVWSFPEPGTCPKGALPKGTVSVVVSDGKYACTATYPAGSAAGRGPKPGACKPT